MSNTVSFIIAAYNEESFIQECIESCLNQTYSDIEVCVTDDGSIDNTWSSLENLALDPRVKINKFNKNKGKVAAFNRSFEMASGDYIAIIGADDVNFPGRITSQIQHIRETQSDLVWGGFEIVDESLNPMSISLVNSAISVTTKNILEKNIVTGGTVLMKRDLALSIFPLPKKLGFEDWWLGYRASTLGNLSYLNSTLIKYRQHANNAAGGSDKNTIDQLRRNFERHLKFYKVVRSDVMKRCDGRERKNLLRVIDGAVAYREICLARTTSVRLVLLMRNYVELLSLSFASISKSVVIAIIGPELFIKLKSWIKS